MVRMGLEVEGLKPFLARVSKLPKTAQAELRERAQDIADDEARRLSAAGRSDDKQSQAVAQFIKSRRDRVPYVQAGGNKKTGVSGGAKAGELFFGAEFGGQSSKRFEDTTKTVTGRTGKQRTVRTGSRFVGKKNTTAQFRPHLGRTGYWFWPQLRRDQERMFSRWEEAVASIEREWGMG
ncbi:MAG: hypothetical protein Q4F65_06935 [Propionibacteriaceae bacterium]|nr:hypothetical protein [Propionibacteriaceae bacterium]